MELDDQFLELNCLNSIVFNKRTVQKDQFLLHSEKCFDCQGKPLTPDEIRKAKAKI